MKKLAIGCLMMCTAIFTANADFNWGRALGAAAQYVQAVMLSDSDIMDYSRQAVAQMDSENRVSPSTSAYSQRLKRITRNFTRADGIALNFKVYETSDVNAFACPDGSVRVFSGLMDMMDDDELTGIVGHEIGHVAKRHSLQALKQEMKNGAYIQALGSLSDTAGALSDSYLSAIGQSLLSARFSRTQENEADDYGYNFLRQNGKTPWAMVKAFEKMQTMEGQGGAAAGYITRMFSSHPQTSQRIQRLSDRARRDGIPRP